jgi:hypothetical protein
MNSTHFKPTKLEFSALDASLDAYVSSTVLFLNTDSTCTQNSNDIFQNDVDGDSLLKGGSPLTDEHLYCYPMDQTASELSYLPTDTVNYFTQA